MKKIIFTQLLIVLSGIMLAQAPEKMSYQAVIRNSSDQLVTNTDIGIQISILQGSNTGTAVYIERHYPTTNANGLVSVEIGGGTVVSGSFATINWASETYFVKTETDLNGGANYTITGTSQILSVPYALYTKTAENISGGIEETDPIFIASPANGITSSNIDNWNTAFGWGTHTGLYRTVTWIPSWTDVTGKPTFATVATSGSYNDLINKPTLFSGSFTDLANKPTTISGYGITNAMNTSHAANGITNANITNWNTAYSWGNHSGLYRTISYVPAWTEITSKPITLSGFGITDAVNIAGTQTISGNKTFSGTTAVSTPVNAQDAATKAYVDALQNQISFLEDKLIISGLIVQDVDNNIYGTIKIGYQVWMAENLKTTKYNDGTTIPLVTDITAWSNLTTPAYCWYNNDEGTYKATYGALYNWYVVSTTTNGSKNVCPSGWHVPTDADWMILTDFLGGETIAGGKLKESGTAHWLYPNSQATNETGFTALPGGYRYYNGGFFGVESQGSWLSATDYDTTYAYIRRLEFNLPMLFRLYPEKGYGLSIRCLKD